MILTIAIFLLTLVTLISIHEFGHFLMAKKFGIKVLEFGFGIPPRAFGKKIGETLVSINWLPFGGFVRLYGEDEVDKKILNNPHSFASQDVLKRITVVLAGVVMNLILAWILFYIVIISQNFRILIPSDNQKVVIADVEENFPAKEAGLKKGDQIISVNNKKVFSSAETITAIRNSSQVNLEVLDSNDKKIKKYTIIPKEENGQKLIGLIFTPFNIVEYKTPIEKIFSGITYSWELTKISFIGLGQVFSNLFVGNFDTASKSVAGPVGIAGAANNILSLKEGAIITYLWFVGLISLTLSIFNVLPIPALDGGRLFFLTIEAVFGKKVHSEIEKNIHAVGLAILLGLSLLITFSDIHKFFE